MNPSRQMHSNTHQEYLEAGWFPVQVSRDPKWLNKKYDWCTENTPGFHFYNYCFWFWCEAHQLHFLLRWAE